MEEQGPGPAFLEDQTIRAPSSLLLAVPGCFAWTAVVLSGLERNNLQTVLAAKSPCPERPFVPSSTEEKSLHYKYIKHMNSSDKRQSNNLFGKLAYALLNSFIGCPTAPSGAFTAARHRNMTSSLESSQKVLPASLL